MGNNIEELYTLVNDLMPKTTFKEEIKERKQRYDDLFDEETLTLLYVDELGRNTTCLSSISDLAAGKDYTLLGSVTQIQNTRTFQRKNGSSGRVANLIITDNSGSIPLVLWDQDVDLVSKKIIKENTPVKIINGYVKDGYQGLELGVGRWSSIEIQEDSTIPPLNNTPIPSPSITGIIQDISPTNAFFKDDGSFGFVTKLRLKTKEETQCLNPA